MDETTRERAEGAPDGTTAAGTTGAGPASGSGSRDDSGPGPRDDSGPGPRDDSGPGPRDDSGSGPRDDSGSGSRDDSGSGSGSGSGEGSAAEALARRFDADRGHLRAVAYRMLGSLSEAEDAVQETWFKLSRTDVSGVANLTGWLTTVIGRVCLDMLRSRGSRREDPLDTYVPDPIVHIPGVGDPEHAAELTESVGLALLVVLETLSPAERLAFVLHDMFAVSFDEIARIVDRTPAATRQLASRARRRVQDADPGPGPDARRQREIADAFLAASQGGDFEGLLAVLDPDAVLRADGGPLLAGASKLVRGAEAIVRQALMYASFRNAALPLVVNGAPAVLGVVDGKPASLLAFTIAGDRIVRMHVLADPERLAALDIPEEALARAVYPD